MCLSNDFIKGNGTHPGCQRRIRKLRRRTSGYLISIDIIE
jgi:hypothetical protein